MKRSPIQEMFQEIAPTYDFLNRILSLRRDIIWRQTLVKALQIPQNARVLDVATGTGDIALEIARQRGKSILVWGMDFALRMLQLGKEKIAGTNFPCNIKQVQADAFYPPFMSESFDAVTCAFGIRNIADKKKVLTVFYKAIKKGGQILILELTLPETGIIKRLYLLYFQKLLPMIGRLISQNSGAYTYLPASVVKFPTPENFCSIMQEAGFDKVSHRRLTLGICTLFTGIKPYVSTL